MSREGYLSTGDDDDHHQSARLQGLFKNDSTSVLLVGEFTHIGGNGYTYAILRPAANISSSPWTAVSDPRVLPYYNAISAAQGSCIPGGFFPGLNNPGACPAVAPYPSPPFPPGTLGPYDSLFKLPIGGNTQDNKFTSTHAEITQDLGAATLTILPAFQKSQMAYTTDPAGLYYVDMPNDSTAESVEARIGGNSAALKWVGGLYYFHETQFSDELISGGIVQNNAAVTHQGTRSEAAFGELNFSVTDTLRLIAGARFTDDNKTENGSVSALYPSVAFLPNPANPTSLKCFAGLPNPCVLESFSGDKSFTKTTWKAGAEYDLTPKNMVYATASTGFKAGGFNQSATAAPGSTTALAYEPEVLTAYELGSRNRFLEDRLQVNLEGFYWKYHNHQEPHPHHGRAGRPVARLRECRRCDSLRPRCRRGCEAHPPRYRARRRRVAAFGVQQLRLRRAVQSQRRALSDRGGQWLPQFRSVLAEVRIHGLRRLDAHDRPERRRRTRRLLGLSAHPRTPLVREPGLRAPS